MLGLADTFYTFRFLKLLVTPWDKQAAFKLGIIDAAGKVLRPAATLKTSEERNSFTLFHRLVFNMKRLLEKLPFGKTKLASYVAALWLLKEHTGMSDKGIKKLVESIGDVEFEMTLTENKWYLDKQGNLQPGTYSLRQDAPMQETYEFRAYAGSKVDITEATKPVGSVLGLPVFKVLHRESRQYIYVSAEDLLR